MVAILMSEFGQPTIFIKLLEQHGSVQVPMIQRDYAQGRESEEEVLNSFLDALEKALNLPFDDPALPLNLDFIYGSLDGEQTQKFQPLDGQQRLTTLFLLHWYLAWRDDRVDEFRDTHESNGKSRFSYAVRPSTTEFYDELVRFQPEGSPDSFSLISSLVTDQPWYYSYWRLDPTIQSSLRVLDAIHKRFPTSQELYSRLTDTDHPAITFQLLDLENFGLSDDLYIKMNARGIPLTNFETFKARYEQMLSQQFGEETTLLDGHNVTIAEFFSRRIDTTWADFFWKYRDTTTNLFDDAVVNFFRVVILLSREPHDDKYLEHVSRLRSWRNKSSFSLFQNSGWLDRNFHDLLVLLLEAWSGDGNSFRTYLPDTRHCDEEFLFKKAIKEPTSLSFAEIIQFVGYIVFMREHRALGDQEVFQEWMRIVFNLSSNTVYDRPEDMQRSISALIKLKPHSGNVLEFFANTPKPTDGFNQQQIAEEKLKAELILADPRWKRLIYSAEGHGYFRGQIEFLLDFCGASAKSQELNCGEWGSDTHSELQEKFKDYLSKAEAMFTTSGLVEMADFRWERALLSIGNYLELSTIGHNGSFLSNPATEPASWKRLLRGGVGKTEARNILKKLLDRLTPSEPTSEQLDQIIASVTTVPDEWRKAFIKTPEAIKYCERRAIRLWEQNHIFLLKKTQLNGTHAELYTYCLYVNVLCQMEEDDLLPLELEEYYSAVGTGVEPGIQLSWPNADKTVYFDIKWNGNNFVVYVRLDELNEFPEVITALKGISFAEQEEESRLERESESAQILNVISDVQRILPETNLIGQD
ncbi:MAG: DUF262 domain-containing protein [Gammaproteobacteria bacterium]|nr:DUF262 domain-containing protein [Gammaproteobacteria bacterium]